MKKGAPNDYIEVLKCACKSFSKYAKFMLAYGIGGRTMDGEGPACKTLFSLSGDFMDPYVETQEELLKSYKGTLQSVKIALPINYRHIV